MFATLTPTGASVVKLPRQRVAALTEAGQGRPFEPSPGRVMKQWLELSPAPARTGRPWPKKPWRSPAAHQNKPPAAALRPRA
jgi:hypothetical protein